MRRIYGKHWRPKLQTTVYIRGSQTVTRGMRNILGGMRHHPIYMLTYLKKRSWGTPYFYFDKRGTVFKKGWEPLLYTVNEFLKKTWPKFLNFVMTHTLCSMYMNLNLYLPQIPVCFFRVYKIPCVHYLLHCIKKIPI